MDLSKNWDRCLSTYIAKPIRSMYGIFTYIYHKNQPNVGIYTIHGWEMVGRFQSLLEMGISTRVSGWGCDRFTIRDRKLGYS